MAVTLGMMEPLILALFYRSTVPQEENNDAINMEMEHDFVIKTESETDDGGYSSYKDDCNCEHVGILCKLESGINDSVVKTQPHFEHVEYTVANHNFEIENLIKKEKLDDHDITENKGQARDVKELSVSVQRGSYQP